MRFSLLVAALRSIRSHFRHFCSVAIFLTLTAATAVGADDAKGGPDTSIQEMSLETPVLLINPLPKYAHHNRDYGMTIGIERTPNGRLWVCYVGGGDSDKGYFILCTSDDDGKSWSEPRLVIDPTEAPNGLRRRVLVGALWSDPSGRLWLFFDQSMGYYDGRAGDWAIVCENPDADVPVWSTPTRIWHGATLNKPIVRSTSEWLLPISLWQRKMINPAELRGWHKDLDADRKAWVFASSDEGKTWEKRGGVVFPGHSFDEHMLIERRDGSLWMLARTENGIAESTSVDGGRTWSTPSIFMPHVVSRFFIRRLASGNLVLVRHGRPDERTKVRSHLTAYLSEDDGKTWTGGLMLDERTGVSYPDGFQDPRGFIYVSYDRNRSQDGEILFAKFTEKDILAGELVTPESSLKNMITRIPDHLRKSGK